MKMTIDLGGSAKFRIGYRSPGLGKELDVEGKMALAKELGMEVIEPMIKPWEIASCDVAREMKAAAAKYGVEIPSVGYIFPFVDPDTTEEQFDKEIETALEYIGVLELDYVFSAVVHPAENIPQKESWDLLVPRARKVAEAFQANNIKFAMEPEWFIPSIERMAKLVRLVDHPNFYVNYDATNFYLGGSDPLEIFDGPLEPLVLKGHLKDAFYMTEKRRECPIGEGELDYENIFKKIIERGKSIDMYIEHCNSSEQVRSAAEYFKGLIASL
jgi:sugar phosphate isomerase/epimerase